MPQRNQIELRPVDLEATLAPEHPARNVWAFVEGLDLSALYTDIGSVEGHAGRAAIDPRILMALWLYATIDGVGSAREIRAADTVARRLSLDLRRGEREPSHAVGFSLRPPGRCWRARSRTASRCCWNRGWCSSIGWRRTGCGRVRAPEPASFRRRSTLACCLEEAEQQIEALRAAAGCRSAGQSTASPSGATALRPSNVPSG